MSIKKANRKEKLAFLVAEEGDNVPARASIVVSCGALLKVLSRLKLQCKVSSPHLHQWLQKVKVFAVLGYREGLADPTSFEVFSPLPCAFAQPSYSYLV